MKKTAFFTISALIVFLGLILPYPSAAQTMLSPQTTTTQPSTITTSPPSTQQPTVSPTLGIRPQVGNALISVRDSYGYPIGDATISMTGNGQTVTQVTNAQGDASFGNIGIGQYTYTVRKEDYYPQTVNVPLSIGLGMTTTSKYVLIRYGSAKVQTTENGKGLAGALVSTTVNGQVVSIKTDADGMAIFGNLPPGNYLFSASMDGFPRPPNQATVSVASGKSSFVPIAVIRYGSAKVQVTYNGTPVADANVTALYGNSGNLLVAPKTDASGITTFSNLYPVSIRFYANKDGYGGGFTDAIIKAGQVMNYSITITTGTAPRR